MKKYLIIALSSALISSALADGAAITSISGGTRFVTWSAANTEAEPGMVGYKFTVNTDTFLTALGIWRDNDNDGLAASHLVGIWRASDSSLIASATLDNTDTLEGDFYFENVATTQLLAGTEYIAAAGYWGGGPDGYISGGTYGTDGNVNLLNAVFPQVNGFSMPTGNSAASNLGRVGPNFKTDAVPEPATMTILGLGALAALRRKKKA